MEEVTEKKPFDFALVYTDEELIRLKRLAMNMENLSRAYIKTLDEMVHRKKRYEKRDNVVK